MPASKWKDSARSEPKEDAAPIFSVIIPVYQDWERMRLCLEALERQTIPPHDIEIIVASNEADAHCPLEDLPTNARVIHEPRTGSYAARNAAVAVSSGKHLAFTDSDCIPEPHWLERALDLLERDPKARVTGPVSVFREAGGGRLACLYDDHTAFTQKRWVERGRCATANLVVSRETFDRVGPFDDRLTSGGDTEWGERAAAAGVSIHYVEEVRVLHPARRSLSDIYRKRRRIAGSEARRKGYPTFWYVVFKLLPPVRTYSKIVYREPRAPVSRLDWLLLFFVHWLGRVHEAWEFLLVRLGWKNPSRA